MKTSPRFFTFAALILAAVAAPMLVMAQQAPGTVGSPSGTTTINGNQLPAPSPPFGGKIDRPQLSPEDVKKLMEAERNEKASE